MGFSISDLNPTSLLSNAAESICDAVLPESLEFVGDLVGLAADFESGNWMKCLEDFQDLAQDLPQQLAQLARPRTGPGGPGDELMIPSFLEPSPPPPYGAASSTQTTTTTTVTTTNGAPPAPANTVGAPAGGLNPGSFASLLQEAHLQMPNQGSSAVTAPTVRGTPASSSPTQSSHSAVPTSGSAGAAPSGQASSASAPSPSSSSSSSSSAAPTDPFFALSDADLMEKVRNGQIPESITKDPGKMQQLQARMNQITEMNQLISQMMAALHDMMKTVIQNIRA